MSSGYERLDTSPDNMLDVGEEKLSLGERFKRYVAENPLRFLMIIFAIVFTLLMVTLVSIALPLLSTKLEDPLLEVFDLCSVNGTYRFSAKLTNPSLLQVPVDDFRVEIRYLNRLILTTDLFPFVIKQNENNLAFNLTYTALNEYYIAQLLTKYLNYKLLKEPIEVEATVIATIRLYGFSFSHAVRKNLWVKGRPLSELTPEEQEVQEAADSTKTISFRHVSVTHNNEDYAQLMFEVLWNQTAKTIEAHMPSLDLECWWEGNRMGIFNTAPIVLKHGGVIGYFYGNFYAEDQAQQMKIVNQAATEGGQFTFHVTGHERYGEACLAQRVANMAWYNNSFLPPLQKVRGEIGEDEGNDPMKREAKEQTTEKPPFIRFIGSHISDITETDAIFELEVVLANGTPLKGRIPALSLSVYSDSPHKNGWKPHNREDIIVNGTMASFNTFASDRRFLDIHFPEGISTANGTQYIITNVTNFGGPTFIRAFESIMSGSKVPVVVTGKYDAKDHLSRVMSSVEGSLQLDKSSGDGESASFTPRSLEIVRMVEEEAHVRLNFTTTDIQVFGKIPDVRVDLNDKQEGKPYARLSVDVDLVSTGNHTLDLKFMVPNATYTGGLLSRLMKGEHQNFTLTGANEPQRRNNVLTNLLGFVKIHWSTQNTTSAQIGNYVYTFKKANSTNSTTSSNSPSTGMNVTLKSVEVGEFSTDSFMTYAKMNPLDIGFPIIGNLPLLTVEARDGSKKGTHLSSVSAQVHIDPLSVDIGFFFPNPDIVGPTISRITNKTAVHLYFCGAPNTRDIIGRVMEYTCYDAKLDPNTAGEKVASSASSAKNSVSLTSLKSKRITDDILLNVDLEADVKFSFKASIPALGFAVGKKPKVATVDTIAAVQTSQIEINNDFQFDLNLLFPNPALTGNTLSEIAKRDKDVELVLCGYEIARLESKTVLNRIMSNMCLPYTVKPKSGDVAVEKDKKEDATPDLLILEKLVLSWTPREMNTQLLAKINMTTALDMRIPYMSLEVRRDAITAPALMGIKTTRFDITNELDVVLSVFSDRAPMAGKAMSDAAEGKNVTFYICGEDSKVTVVNTILSHFCLPYSVNSDTKKRADWISENLLPIVEEASAEELGRKRAIVSPGNYLALTSVTARDITNSIRVLLAAQLKLPVTVDGILPAAGINFKREKTDAPTIGHLEGSAIVLAEDMTYEIQFQSSAPEELGKTMSDVALKKPVTLYACGDDKESTLFNAILKYFCYPIRANQDKKRNLLGISEEQDTFESQAIKDLVTFSVAEVVVPSITNTSVHVDIHAKYKFNANLTLNVRLPAISFSLFPGEDQTRGSLVVTQTSDLELTDEMKISVDSSFPDPKGVGKFLSDVVAKKETKFLFCGSPSDKRTIVNKILSGFCYPYTINTPESATSTEPKDPLFNVDIKKVVVPEMTSSTVNVKLDMLLRLRLGFALKMKLPVLGVGVARQAGPRLLTTKSTSELNITDGVFTLGLQVEVPDPDPVGALLTDIMKTEKLAIPIVACGLEGHGTTIINRIVEGFCYTWTINDPKDSGSSSKLPFELTSKDFQLTNVADTVDFSFIFGYKLGYTWAYEIAIPSLSADFKTASSVLATLSSKAFTLTNGLSQIKLEASLSVMSPDKVGAFAEDYILKKMDKAISVCGGSQGDTLAARILRAFCLTRTIQYTTSDTKSYTVDYAEIKAVTDKNVDVEAQVTFAMPNGISLKGQMPPVTLVGRAGTRTSANLMQLTTSRLELSSVLKLQLRATVPSPSALGQVISDLGQEKYITLFGCGFGSENVISRVLSNFCYPFDVNKPKKRAIADVAGVLDNLEALDAFDAFEALAAGDQKPSAKVLGVEATGSYVQSGLYWAGIRANIELTDNPVRGNLPAFAIEIKSGPTQIVKIEMDPLEIKSGAKTTVSPHVRVAVIPAQKVPVETNVSRYLTAYANIASCQKKTPVDKCVSIHQFKWAMMLKGVDSTSNVLQNVLSFVRYDLGAKLDSFHPSSSTVSGGSFPDILPSIKLKQTTTRSVTVEFTLPVRSWDVDFPITVGSVALQVDAAMTYPRPYKVRRSRIIEGNVPNVKMAKPSFDLVPTLTAINSVDNFLKDLLVNFLENKGTPTAISIAMKVTSPAFASKPIEMSLNNINVPTNVGGGTSNPDNEQGILCQTRGKVSKTCKQAVPVYLYLRNPLPFPIYVSNVDGEVKFKYGLIRKSTYKVGGISLLNRATTTTLNAKSDAQLALQVNVDMGVLTCGRAGLKSAFGDIGAWVDWISACVGVMAPGSSQRFELCHTLRPAAGGAEPPACKAPKYPCPIC